MSDIDELIEGNHGLVVACDLSSRSTYLYHESQAYRPRALDTLKAVIERLNGYQWDSYISHTRKDLCATIYIYRGLTPDIDNLPFLTVK